MNVIAGQTFVGTPWHLAGLDVPVSIRFGGDGSTTHAMLLRFGEMGLRDALAAHLLVEFGNKVLVARDALVWDDALLQFRTGDASSVIDLVETLDVTTAICGGIARTADTLVTGTIEFLTSMLVPRVFVIGSVFAIVSFFFFHYLLLWFLAHWLFWLVILPCCLVGPIAAMIRDARLARLHGTILAAAQAELERRS